MNNPSNTVVGNNAVPMGVVANIEGAEAKLWTFPRAVFGPEEIQINLTGKTALQVGDWVYLKERSKGNYLFKCHTLRESHYMESASNSKGILELRGFVFLKRSSTSEYEAWSPDLGKVAAITRKDYNPGLYDVTFIRTKEKFKLINHSFAIAVRKPIIQVCQILEEDFVPLERSKVRYIGIVINETRDYYYAWTSPFGVVNAYVKNKSLKFGSWIEHYSEWFGYGQESSIITNYKEIEPELQTFYCGSLYIAVSSTHFVGKALLRSCSSTHLDNANILLVVWKENGWEICEKFPVFLHENSTNMVIASPQQMRPEANSRQSEYIGIAVQGSNDSISCQLYVCPLKGEPLISLKYPWYGEEAEEVKPGDWVSVQMCRDSVCGYVSKSPAHKVSPLLPSRINRDGLVEVQTLIKNVWRTEFDVYCVSEDLGTVKDIYETIPECDIHDQFLVWCVLLIKPVDGCYWALAKGEPVEKVYRIGKKADSEVAPYRSHQNSEGYYSDEGNSTSRSSAEENKCNPTSSVESYCKGTIVPPGYNITAKEFLASVRRLLDDRKLQKILCERDKNLYLEIRECLNLLTDGIVKVDQKVT